MIVLICCRNILSSSLPLNHFSFIHFLPILEFWVEILTSIKFKQTTALNINQHTRYNSCKGFEAPIEVTKSKFRRIRRITNITKLAVNACHRLPV